MVTEDYVSFETAKLLKERGFDEECSCFYNNIDYGTPGLEVDGQLYYINSALDDEEYAAPTLQMAMKWLRVVYSLEIYPYHNSPNNRHNSEWWFEIIKYPNSVAEYESGIDEEVDTYEQACDAAINYCLENLI